MAKRRIAVVTGSRAEYGILYWLLKEIQARPNLELQLLVTGMHLSPEFGLTVRQIEADGFAIAEKIETLLSSDSEVAVSTAIALGVMGFAHAFARERPDIVVLQGDRFESLAAAIAAMVARVPIAHISGGKSTQGVIDEAIRHALTKMSHLHFTHMPEHRDRIIQMGEDPRRVYAFGAPLVDGIKRLQHLSKTELEERIGSPLAERFLLVVYHPVTLEDRTEEAHMDQLFRALDQFPQLQLIFIMPNADTGGRIISERIRAYVKTRPRAQSHVNLERGVFLNLLRLATAIIGNSSSGITEAPSFELPAVNIGDRQRGVTKAANVIDCHPTTASIVAAIRRALQEDFRRSLAGLTNPYGDGDSSKRIADILEEVELGEALLKKRFHPWVGPTGSGGKAT